MRISLKDRAVKIDEVAARGTTGTLRFNGRTLEIYYETGRVRRAALDEIAHVSYVEPAASFGHIVFERRIEEESNSQSETFGLVFDRYCHEEFASLYAAIERYRGARSNAPENKLLAFLKTKRGEWRLEIWQWVALAILGLTILGSLLSERTISKMAQDARIASSKEQTARYQNGDRFTRRRWARRPLQLSSKSRSHDTLRVPNAPGRIAAAGVNTIGKARPHITAPPRSSPGSSALHQPIKRARIQRLARNAHQSRV